MTKRVLTTRTAYLILNGPSLDGLKYVLNSRERIIQGGRPVDQYCSMSLTILKCYKPADRDELVPKWPHPVDLPIVPANVIKLFKSCHTTGMDGRRVYMDVRVARSITQEQIGFEDQDIARGKLVEGAVFEIYYDANYRVGCLGLRNSDLNSLGYDTVKRMLDNRKLLLLSSGTLPLDVFGLRREITPYKSFFKVKSAQEAKIQEHQVVQFLVSKVCFDAMESEEILQVPAPISVEIWEIEERLMDFKMLYGQVVTKPTDVPKTLGFSNDCGVLSIKESDKVLIYYNAGLGVGSMAIYDKTAVISACML